MRERASMSDKSATRTGILSSLKAIRSEKGKRMTLWQTFKYLRKVWRDRKKPCPYCYGKRRYSVMYFLTGFADFPGDKDYKQKMLEDKPCPRCTNFPQ